MKLLYHLFTEELTTALGWTLLHALWQGALLAILLGITLVLMRKYSSKTRYFVALISLSLFVASTVATFYVMYAPALQVEHRLAEYAPALPPSTTVESEVDPERSEQGEQIDPEVREDSADLFAMATDYFAQHIPLIVTLWLLGVLILLLRFLGNLAYIERLKHHQTEVMPKAWVEKAMAISEKMQLRKKVAYLSSRIAPTPMAIGLLKPTVIMPAKIISGLSEKEVEAILAHELAHILRNDFLINIIQTFFEILFFYHPAVWWISATIRHERENCCDDIAITITGESCDYAKTLIMLQEERLNQAIPAMAFTGLRYKFSHRIERLFNQPNLQADFKEGFITALLFVGGILTITFNAIGSSNFQETPPEATALMALDEEEVDQADYIEPTATEIQPQIELKAAAKIPEDQVQSHVPANDSDLELLLEAIDDENLQLVKFMLDKGIDVNASTEGGWTPLLEAADGGSLEIMQLLIDRGANVNKGNQKGWTPLMEAAEEGHLAMVKLLLDQGVDPDQPNRWGATALMQAADEGNLEVAKLLIDRGADVNLLDKEGHTALTAAIDEGHQGMVQLLIDKGAKISTKGKGGNMALFEAADEGQVEVLQMLLDNGANPNAADEEGYSILMEAADEGHLAVIRTLLDNGADVNQASRDGVTALMIAADEGETEVVRLLIDKGADVNQRSEDGVDALLTATDEGHLEIVQLLIDEGIDFNDRSNYALVEAADEGHLELVKMFLAKGADPNAETEDGQTAFLEAIDDRQLEIVRLFLENGVDANAKNRDGYTGLMEAADEEDLRMAELLLSYGADVNAKDNNGCTALMEAADESNEALVKLFIAKGADVNVQSTGGWIDGWNNNKSMIIHRGWTALFEAIDEYALTVAKVLLNNGAHVNATMSKTNRDYRSNKETLHENWTPLMEAVERGQADMVELLLDKGANAKATTRAGMTVLDIANQTGNKAIIQMISNRAKN